MIYYDNYVRNIHSIDLILSAFTMEAYFVQYIHLLLKKKIGGKMPGSAARLGWGFYTPNKKKVKVRLGNEMPSMSSCLHEISLEPMYLAQIIATLEIGISCSVLCINICGAQR